MKPSKFILVILFFILLLFIVFQTASNKFVLQAQTQGYPLNYVAPSPKASQAPPGGNQGYPLNLVPSSPGRGNTGPYSTSAPAPENVQNKTIPNSSVPTTTQDPAATNKYVSNIQYFDMMGRQQGMIVSAMYGPNPCTPLTLGGSGFYAIQLIPYNSGSERYAYMPVRVSYRIEFKDASGNVIKKIEGAGRVNYDKWGGKSPSGWIYGFYSPQEVRSIAGNRRFRNYYEIWFNNSDPGNIIQFDLWAREKSIILAQKTRKKNQVKNNNLLKYHEQISFRAGGLLAQNSGASTAQASGSACMGISGNQGGGETAGCPVDIVSGSLVEDYTDMILPTGLAIKRHYDSGMGYQPGRNFGWAFNFEEFLRFDPDGSIFYRSYKFSEKRFLRNLSDLNNYIPSRSDNLLKLRKDADGNYEIIFKDQTKKVFNSIGYLINTIDSKGNATNYTWNIPFQQMRENYNMPAELIALNGPNEIFRKNSTLTITDPYGRSVNVYFNDNGRVSKIADWTGRYVEYSWSGNGNMFLMAFKDLQGNQTQFSYTENTYNNISEIKYPNGARVVNNFLSSGPPNSQVVKYQNLTDGGSISYDYGWLRDPQERWTTVNESGRTVKYYYDENGNITGTEEPGPNGSVNYRFTYYYDTDNLGIPANLLASKTDPLGRTTRYTYDARGNLTEIRNAQGKIRKYKYDDKDRMTDFWDELNRNTHFEYDDKNNLLSIRNKDGTAKRFEYDEKGRLTKSTDENGNYLVYEYGAFEGVAKITDQEGGYAIFYRDSLGRVVKVDANGFETNYKYDNFGNITEIAGKSGNKTRLSYDGNCNLTAAANSNGEINQFGYDSFNRLTQKTDPDGNISIYRYNPRGKLMNMIDPKRGYISYDYNPADSANWLKDQMSTATYYSYDPAGNITVTGNSSAGKRCEFVYDGLNRVVKKIGDGEALYEYDDAGNIKAVNDKSGQTLYEYDDMNRITRVSYPLNGIKSEFKYDNAGNIAYVKHINGAEFYYEYDKANKLVSIIKKGEGRINFAYNDCKNLAMIEYPNGVQKFIAYDDLKNIVRIKYLSGKSGEILYLVSYEYDNAGSITGKEVSGIGRGHKKLSYVYTGSGKLAQVKMNDKTISDYKYDANGNRISSVTSTGRVSYNYDPANRLLNTSQTDYFYDNAGNLIKEKSGSKVKNYFYDTENNFTKFEFTGAGKFSENYSYNASNLRTLKECAEKKEKSNLIWLGWDLQGEIDKDGGFDFVNYGLGFEKNGKSYWYIEDIQGSIVGVADKEGNLVTAYEYDEFGNPVSSTVSGEAAPSQTAPTMKPPAAPPPGTPAPSKSAGTPLPSLPGTPPPQPSPKPTGAVTPYPLNLVPPKPQPTSGAPQYPINLVPQSPAPASQPNKTGLILPAANAQAGAEAPGTQVKKTNAFIEFIKKIFSFWKKPEVKQTTQEKEIVNKIESPIRFAGYYYDKGTELYYVKSRYYDPETGRFTQPDKISYLAGLNLYAYCNNDPVNYVDPNGATFVFVWIFEGPPIVNPSSPILLGKPSPVSPFQEVLNNALGASEATAGASAASAATTGATTATTAAQAATAQAAAAQAANGVRPNPIFNPNWGAAGGVGPTNPGAAASGAGTNSPNSTTSCSKGGNDVSSDRNGSVIGGDAAI